MKLHSNYNRKEWKGAFLSWAIVALVVFVPANYAIDNLFIPFSEATIEFIEFADSERFIEKWYEQYDPRTDISSLDRESLVLFTVFQFTGGIIISGVVIMLFMSITAQATLVILRKVKVLPTKKLKISRKPLEDESTTV